MLNLSELEQKIDASLSRLERLYKEYEDARINVNRLKEEVMTLKRERDVATSELKKIRLQHASLKATKKIVAAKLDKTLSQVNYLIDGHE